MQTKEIGIVGAGIAGLTAAIAIRKYRPDWKIEIFESSHELKPVGAGLGLGANAVSALNELGIKEDVIAVSQIMEHFDILEENGRLISRIDNMAINQELGTVSHFAVHRADLHEVLLNQLDGVNIILNKRLSSFTENKEGIELHFTDGTKVQKAYIIASDGIHSIFRKTLLPPGEVRFAGYTCWRGVASFDKGSDQIWSKQSGAIESWGNGKRFGIVPLPNRRIYWFCTINAPKSKDPKFAAYTQNDLIETFSSFHKPVVDVIKATEADKILWNDIIDFPPIDKFAFDRIVLLGDSAHATTPNMGQGACQAIEGAVILGKCLAANSDPIEAFREYEARRLKRTAAIVKTSWTLGKVGQWSNPLAIKIRNGLMRLVPASQNVKQVKNLLDVKF